MNRDELSVYADELQIAGDIRGEIIAIELLLDEHRRPDLVARHEALTLQWMNGWPVGDDTRIRYGFVDCPSSDLARIAQTPAAPYLRSVSISGTNTEIQSALSLLVSAPRPHLRRLAITSGRRWGEPRARTQPLVDAAVARKLLAATPALEMLDVTGSRIIDAFPHPTLQRLRVIGHDAFGALADGGPPLPAVRSLFFAVTPDPSGRVAFGRRALPRTLLARATLPALVELDISANALQRAWDNHHVAIFELVAELGVLPQLARLRVPAGDPEAVAHLRALTTAAVEDTGDRPQPLHDELGTHDTLRIRIGAQPWPRSISHHRLGELMSAAWPALDEDARAAWRALWHALNAVPLDPDDVWPNEGDGTLVPRARFADALATLGEVEDDLSIARFAEAVLRSVDSRTHVRRSVY